MQQINYALATQAASSLPGLRPFSKLLVFSTLFLIFVGSLITTFGGGLSVPDWPTTYGHFMFSFPLSQMVGGIFYEHGHRMVASVVGCFTAIVTIWTLLKEKRQWVRRLAFFCFIAVLLQGGLGGLTVLFYLPTVVSVSHAILAQSFFILTVVLAYSFSKERRLRQMEMAFIYDKSFAKRVLALVVLVYCQLILGAVMRHTDSGLAVPDFPSMGGQYLPLITKPMMDTINGWRFEVGAGAVSFWQVVSHLSHRFLGMGTAIYGATLLYGATKRVVWKRKSIRTLITAIGILLFCQVGLGVGTVLGARPLYITGLHVALGASLLGLSVLLLLRSLPLEWKRVYR